MAPYITSTSCVQRAYFSHHEKGSSAADKEQRLFGRHDPERSATSEYFRSRYPSTVENLCADIYGRTHNQIVGETEESAMADAVPAAVKNLGRHAVPPRFDQPDHCASLPFRPESPRPFCGWWDRRSESHRRPECNHNRDIAERIPPSEPVAGRNGLSSEPVWSKN